MKGKVVGIAKHALKLTPAIRDEYERSVASRILTALPAFAPYAQGSMKERASLTVLAAQQTVPLLCELLSSVSTCKHRELADVESICDDPESRTAANQLEGLFARHGSDKSTDHNYHWLYGRILRRPSEVRNLLEVGIGTNNADVISNMGTSGVPGASLRAFREFLPSANIYGADIDRRILFQEERIKTFFVDQTDLASFETLAGVTPEAFDLIIDDGLHAPNANIATMVFALKKIRVGGWFVVEDIPEASIPIWRLVASILPSRYTTFLLAARNAIVLAVENSAVA